MRFKNRLLGGLLTLFGAVILGESAYGLFNKRWKFETSVLFDDGIFIAAGLGLILAGRWYWRMDLDGPVEVHPTSFTHFLVNHRHQLKVAAQTGAALSVLGVIAALFGWNWPVRGTWFPLVLGAFILDSFAKKVANPDITDNRDWMRVPEWIRRTPPAMPKAFVVAQVCVVGISLLSMWTRYSLVDTRGYRLGVRIFAYGLTAFMYALQFLFFQYGELRDESDLTVT